MIKLYLKINEMSLDMFEACRRGNKKLVNFIIKRV